MSKKSGKPTAGDRVTYRELRNTPGQVWERLAQQELLTLVADGEAKALLIPVPDGDVNSVYEAYVRGRAMVAASRLRRSARVIGAPGMTLDDVNALIRKTRAARRPGRRR